jgi:hypothetical protein
MSEGPKKAEDKLNMIGVVVVGICGAVLVYVSIVLLQAFYVNDSSAVNLERDFDKQDSPRKLLRAAQLENIGEYRRGGQDNGVETFRIPIDQAMSLVLEDAKADPSKLIPAVGVSDKETIAPVYGRPQPLAAPPATPTPTPEVVPGATPGTPGAPPAPGTPGPGAGQPMPDAPAAGVPGGPAPTLPGAPAAPATPGAAAPTTPTAPAPAPAAPAPTPAAPARGGNGP